MAKTREPRGSPQVSLPLQSHSDITEEELWERSALRSPIPPAISNARRQPLKTGHDRERDHEHIERVDGEPSFSHLEIRRSSFESSSTVDTVEFVRKLAAGERKFPITTSIATTEKPQPIPRRKRWYRKIGILCSIFALIALIVIPVVCVCILTGVFVPDEARTDQGKSKDASKSPQAMPTTPIHTAAATVTSQSSPQSTTDTPDVTWLATATKTDVPGGTNTAASTLDPIVLSVTGAGYPEDQVSTSKEAPTTMETRRAQY